MTRLSRCAGHGERAMIESQEELAGRPLGAAEPFPFRCHSGLICFTSCCRDKRLSLLPYDVLRLARGLGLSTGELLAKHGELEIEPGSGWPALRIRLEADGRCPFVAAAGCGVYADRPTCCRIYPLARAVSLGEGGTLVEAFVVDASKTRCGGFGADAELTVEGWTRGQGLDAYRAANNRTARLLLDPRRPRPLALSPTGVHAVVMALYNLDVFRDVVKGPCFAVENGVSPSTVARALTSDDALLELAQDWLAARLFGGQPCDPLTER
jgi:uncharacterized protein